MCPNNKILVPVVFLILLSQMLVVPQGTVKPRIRNGFPCDTTIAPYFVMFDIIYENNHHACGGCLITYSWVLTGAHCLGPAGVKIEGKVFSAYDRPPELKQVRNIKEVHSHPNYNHTEYNKKHDKDLRGDIGLILVDEPFHETAATRLATLPASGFTKYCNQVLAPGIGRTYDNENTFPYEKRPLLCANLSIIDINICKENYTKTGAKYFDTTHTICTYGEGIRGPCPGDSGGPLICDNTVIGTVMSGGGCDRRYVPTSFAMVENYLEFIDHHIKFTGISIKHGPVNDTGGGGQKASDKSPANANNTHVHTNGTEGSGKKNSNKSPANMVQGPNWKLSFFTLLYLIVLCH